MMGRKDLTEPSINRFPPNVVLFGGTGQAKVVRPIIEFYGSKVVAVFDETHGLIPPFEDVPLYVGLDGFLKWVEEADRGSLGFCLAIGNPHGRARIQLHERLVEEGLSPITLAHPTAWIAENATVGAGSQILAGAIVGVEARLGRECIVNTKASVDHECVLEDGVELAPGVTLCGVVRLGVNAWVCAGATVLPRITIGDDATVGAGSVVTLDVPRGVTVVGVPAKTMVKTGTLTT